MELIKKETFNLLTDDDVTLIKQFKELEIRYKVLKSEKDQQLIEWMKAQNLTTYDDEVHGVRITYKRPTTRKSLDATRLKNEKPDIYSTYLKESEVKESIMVSIDYD